MSVPRARIASPFVGEVDRRRVGAKRRPMISFAVGRGLLSSTSRHDDLPLSLSFPGQRGADGHVPGRRRALISTK